MELIYETHTIYHLQLFYPFYCPECHDHYPIAVKIKGGMGCPKCGEVIGGTLNYTRYKTSTINTENGENAHN